MEGFYFDSPGIGAVMAEVAHLLVGGAPVTALELLRGLRSRYEITEEAALGALQMAVTCGVVELLPDGTVLLKSRPR